MGEISPFSTAIISAVKNGNLVNPTNLILVGRGMVDLVEGEPAKKTRRNWLKWAGLAVAVYLVFLVWLIGPSQIIRFFSEHPPLNNVGDFLAGAFAIPAFIFLAAAVVTQREELEETRAQLDDAREVTAKQMQAINRQNDIALKAAKANYKVQVHDKRMVAYQRMLSAETAIIRDGDVTRETVALIHRCTADAKFVFGNVVNDWIANFISEARELHSLNSALEALERTLDRAGTPAPESSEWGDMLTAIHEKQTWFYDNLTTERIDEVLGEALRLPEDIE